MEITIEDLRQYQELKEQITVLQREREAVYFERPSPAEVKGGRSSVRTISDPTAAKVRKALQLDERIDKKRKELEARAELILEWSTTVPDPEVAAIIRVHYINGLTWEKTCNLLYGYPDRQYCRHKVRNWFKRRETNDNEETDS